MKFTRETRPTGSARTHQAVLCSGSEMFFVFLKLFFLVMMKQTTGTVGGVMLVVTPVNLILSSILTLIFMNENVSSLITS